MARRPWAAKRPSARADTEGASAATRTTPPRQVGTERTTRFGGVRRFPLPEDAAG